MTDVMDQPTDVDAPDDHESAAPPPRASLDSPAFRLAADRPKLRTDLWLPFADGLYHFALPSAQLAELEQACAADDARGERKPTPIGVIYGNLAQGRMLLPGGAVDWSKLGTAAATLSAIMERECHAVVRLGLIGGGEGVVSGESVKVSPSRAAALMRAYVEGQPLEDAWHYAFAILGARICGVPVAADD